MRSAPLFASLLLILLVLPPHPVAAQGKDWTILVYMDADNNLERWGIADFLEMASVGSTAQVNIVVQFDRAGADPRYGGWTDTRRFYVTRGLTPDPQNNLSDLGEVNMADPASLSAFVNWGILNYPAQRFFLVLWDHGLGWQGVIADDVPVAGDRLTAPELRTAMSAVGRRIDLIGNDACRMTLEIDYELADFADYFVGSEKDEPLEGWPYDAFLGALIANPSMGPPELASILVDRYVASYRGNSSYSVALSAVNAAALRPFVGNLNAFLGELGIHEPYFTNDVIAARDATERYETGLEYDLHHFVENLLTRIPSRRLERSADALFAAFDAAVVHEAHWDNPNPVNGVHAANAHGLSLFFPAIGGGGPAYAALTLSQDSAWDEFLLSYASGSRPQVAANADASATDANLDGYADGITLQYAPAINGTMWVDVYRDGSYAISRQYAVSAGRADTVRLGFAIGGRYEVTFYLIQGTSIVNLTVVPDLVVQELIRFHGYVTGRSGGPMGGATVTLIDLPSGRSLSTTTAGDGSYAITVPYPTWFQSGGPMLLEVTAGEARTTVTFNATIGPDRTIEQDVALDTLGLAPWYAVIGILLVLVAVALGGVWYYRRRLRGFLEPPT